MKLFKYLWYYRFFIDCCCIKCNCVISTTLNSSINTITESSFEKINPFFLYGVISWYISANPIFLNPRTFSVRNTRAVPESQILCLWHVNSQFWNITKNIWYLILHNVLWFNLFVTSKNETTNSPIHKFKVLQKRPDSLLNPLFNCVLFLISYFKKKFKRCFSIFKALKDILQHFKFVN